MLASRLDAADTPGEATDLEVMPQSLALPSVAKCADNSALFFIAVSGEDGTMITSVLKDRLE
jgi:hypothetical protein